MNPGGTIAYSILTVAFGFAFIVWAFAPAAQPPWDLLIQILRIIAKEL